MSSHEAPAALTPEALRQLKSRALSHFQQGLFHSALGGFKTIERQVGLDAEGAFYCGACYLELKRPQLGVKYACIAIRINREMPHVAQAMRLRGTCYLHQKKYTEATADLIMAADLTLSDGGDPTEFYLPLGAAFFHENQFEDAGNCFSRILEIIGENKKHPLFAEVSLWRGRVLTRVGDLDEALACIESAIEIAPSPFAFYARAQIHASAKRTDEAIADYNLAIAGNTEFPEALLWRAKAHMRKKDYDAAIDDLTTILGFPPEILDVPSITRLYKLRIRCYEATFQTELAATDQEALAVIQEGDRRRRGRR